MDIKQMVESITKEILQSMNVEKIKKQELPRVLYVFCDSTAHEAFTDQFIQLQNHGICHDILFLDGETSSWLGMHKIECGGAGKILTADEYAPAPQEVPKDYVGIVIPEIDLDNASRVVAGMKGTIKAEIIFAALVTQKFVIVGEDVPGIKRSDRRTLKTLSLPPGYQKLFARQIDEMKELGIEFDLQKRLAERVIQKVKKSKAVSQETTEIPSADVEDDAKLVFSEKLLTADWIRLQSRIPGNTIYVNNGSIVSPLAYDVLREKGISLQYIGRG